MIPIPLTVADRLRRSEAALYCSNWRAYDAIAAFRVNTRLFVRGDIVFCQMNNGQGIRCIVCGWSSKRGPLGLKRSGTIYASFCRDEMIPKRAPHHVEWLPHFDRANLIMLVSPGEIPSEGLLLSPEARVLVTHRYVQRFPHAGKHR